MFVAPARARATLVKLLAPKRASTTTKPTRISLPRLTKKRSFVIRSAWITSEINVNSKVNASFLLIPPDTPEARSETRTLSSIRARAYVRVSSPVYFFPPLPNSLTRFARHGKGGASLKFYPVNNRAPISTAAPKTLRTDDGGFTTLREASARKSGTLPGYNKRFVPLIRARSVSPGRVEEPRRWGIDPMLNPSRFSPATAIESRPALSRSARVATIARDLALHIVTRPPPSAFPARSNGSEIAQRRRQRAVVKIKSPPRKVSPSRTLAYVVNVRVAPGERAVLSRTRLPHTNRSLTQSSRTRTYVCARARMRVVYKRQLSTGCAVSSAGMTPGFRNVAPSRRKVRQ